MYMHGDTPLPDSGFTLGEGEAKISFPPGWLSRAAEEDLARYGIVSGPDPGASPEPEPEPSLPDAPESSLPDAPEQEPP